MAAFVHSHNRLRRKDAFRKSRCGSKPQSRFLFYSHFHLRVHVLYYLWSHSETAHCSSPASYQEFVPGKLIREERRPLSCRSNSCKPGPFLERNVRCWGRDAEAQREVSRRKWLIKVSLEPLKLHIVIIHLLLRYCNLEEYRGEGRGAEGCS